MDLPLLLTDAGPGLPALRAVVWIGRLKARSGGVVMRSVMSSGSALLRVGLDSATIFELGCAVCADARVDADSSTPGVFGIL